MNPIASYDGVGKDDDAMALTPGPASCGGGVQGLVLVQMAGRIGGVVAAAWRRVWWW